MNGWVCPMLNVSPAHRLFMWLCEEQPLPLSAAHPHPSVSHSAWAGLRGKSDLFCRGEFLGEIVKAATVWAFISVERRRGAKREKEQARGRQRGVVEESLDTDSLVKQQPQRARGRGGERKENATIIMKQAVQQKNSEPHYVTGVILLLLLCFPMLLLIRYPHLAPCTPALQVNNKLLPSPSPFFARFSPSAIALQAFY